MIAAPAPDQCLVSIVKKEPPVQLRRGWRARVTAVGDYLTIGQELHRHARTVGPPRQPPRREPTPSNSPTTRGASERPVPLTDLIPEPFPGLLVPLFLEGRARVLAHSYAPYDATQPWGADPDGINAVLTALGGESDRLAHAEADLADPSAPERLVGHAVERRGTLDALVIRAALLLVRAFADQYRSNPDGGRIVLFTSGQHRGPLPAEIPYAATKGALHQIIATLADALAERDITVNCVNPGPTDIGWAIPEPHAPRPMEHPSRGGRHRRAAAIIRCRDHHRPSHRRRGRIPALHT
jgi:3-oxoacyl-[acyl-carrier protein] reductase